jgi:uncharacterized protein YerC
MIVKEGVMTKLSRKYTDPEKMGAYINNLWSAFTLMDSKEDIRLLFKDLFTHTEYKMFAKRLEIARRLFYKERYEDIQHDLNVTPNTINRISNALSEKGDGLRKVHKKLERLEEKYLSREREYEKNLSNPFRRKIHRKTLLGASLKAGAIALDKVINRKLKEKTAAKTLSV